MRLAIAAALPLLLTLPARAEPLRAVYGVQAAGMQVMRVEVIFAIDDPARYRIESRLSLTGVAGWLSQGRQSNRVEGVWAGDQAWPIRFTGDGFWRGEARRVEIGYREGHPALLRLSPAEEPDRESVPPGLRHNTVDSLTALAQLTRNLARTGRCEGQVAIFDGRRRADLAARTLGRDRLAPWGGAWSGEAVRCGFTGRQIAGFRHEDGQEAREPQEGLAWMASPWPGAPIVPVRVEMPGRWLGRLTGYLLEAAPLVGSAGQ